MSEEQRAESQEPKSKAWITYSPYDSRSINFSRFDVIYPYLFRMVPPPRGSAGPEFQAAVTLVQQAQPLLDCAESSLELFETMLGPCDGDCECIIHPLRSVIAKARGHAS